MSDTPQATIAALEAQIIAQGRQIDDLQARLNQAVQWLVTCQTQATQEAVTYELELGNLRRQLVQAGREIEALQAERDSVAGAKR